MHRLLPSVESELDLPVQGFRGSGVGWRGRGQNRVKDGPLHRVLIGVEGSGLWVYVIQVIRHFELGFPFPVLLVSS